MISIINFHKILGIFSLADTVGTGSHWGYQESISIRYLISLHWRVLLVLLGTGDIKNLFP